MIADKDALCCAGSQSESDSRSFAMEYLETTKLNMTIAAEHLERWIKINAD